jgi:hypothetical protein
MTSWPASAMRFHFSLLGVASFDLVILIAKVGRIVLLGGRAAAKRLLTALVESLLVLVDAIIASKCF